MTAHNLSDTCKVVECTIAEGDLEDRLDYAEECIDNLEVQLRTQYQIVDAQDKDITVYKRALELLADKVVSFYTPAELADGYGCNINYYINKAKEQLAQEED